MQLIRIYKEGNPSLARIACLLGGAVWGVFWIPLRNLDEAGISGAWATAVFHTIPILLLLPVIALRTSRYRLSKVLFQAVGFTMGLSLVLYSTAFLYTDVVRVVALYYLTPIWGALLGRIWLKEQISGDRIVGICLGLIGMLVILNVDQGLPLPQNGGDWMALAGGVIWAIAATLMRQNPQVDALTTLSVWFFWCSVLAVILALFMQSDRALPQFNVILNQLPWLLPVILLIVVPGYFAITWGTPQLNPGTSGLLLMTEISVGTLTAAWLTSEIIGSREIIGIILISLAGLSEVLLPALRNALRSTTAS
jgi:drug/metabolite transporter (DMT)-like permease